MKRGNAVPLRAQPSTASPCCNLRTSATSAGGISHIGMAALAEARIIGRGVTSLARCARTAGDKLPSPCLPRAAK